MDGDMILIGDMVAYGAMGEIWMDDSMMDIDIISIYLLYIYIYRG